MGVSGGLVRRREAVARLGRAHPRRQSADHAEDVCLSTLIEFCRPRYRHPELPHVRLNRHRRGIGGPSRKDRVGHDADDRERLAAEPHIAADEVASPAEMLLPEGMREHHDALVPGNLVARGERTADKRRDAERVKVVRRGADSAHGDRALRRIEGEPRRAEQRDRLEHTGRRVAPRRVA